MSNSVEADGQAKIADARRQQRIDRMLRKFETTPISHFMRNGSPGGQAGLADVAIVAIAAMNPANVIACEKVDHALDALERVVGLADQDSNEDRQATKTIRIFHHTHISNTLYMTEISEDDPAPMMAAVERAVAQKISLANAYLPRVNLSYVDLTGADLRGANLCKADLHNATLVGARLSGADLSNADLSSASLAGADLAAARIMRANLACADLTCAILHSANLRDANLAGANLIGASLNDNAGLPAGFVAQPITAGNAESVSARFRASHPSAPVVEHLDARMLQALEREEGSVIGMPDWYVNMAIHLAGEGGAALEQEIGSRAACIFICLASTGRVPDFYASKWAMFKYLREWPRQEDASTNKA